MYVICDNYYSVIPRDAFGDKYRDISNLIEHPVPVQPPGEPSKSVALPIILTSKERKKLRKQRRREAEKEKQEKIQFGLIEKPEPKVRYSDGPAVLETLAGVPQADKHLVAISRKLLLASKAGYKGKGLLNAGVRISSSQSEGYSITVQCLIMVQLLI